MLGEIGVNGSLDLLQQAWTVRSAQLGRNAHFRRKCVLLCVIVCRAER